MGKLKALFYLPLKDNDGRDLRADIDDLRMELYAHFVGWTSLGYAKGAYRMPDGTQALDEHEAFVVILDPSRVGELEQVLREFRRKTLQAAIYLEIQHD